MSSSKPRSTCSLFSQSTWLAQRPGETLLFNEIFSSKGEFPNFTFLSVLVEECSCGAVLQTGLRNGMSRHLAIKLDSPLSLQIVVGCSGCISCSSPGQGALREPRSQSQSQPRQLQCHRHHSKPF